MGTRRPLDTESVLTRLTKEKETNNDTRQEQRISKDVMESEDLVDEFLIVFIFLWHQTHSPTRYLHF